MTDEEINDLDSIEIYMKKLQTQKEFDSYEFVDYLSKACAVFLNFQIDLLIEELPFVTLLQKNGKFLAFDFEKNEIAVEVFEKCVKFMKKHNSQIQHKFKGFVECNRFFVV